MKHCPVKYINHISNNTIKSYNMTVSITNTLYFILKGWIVFFFIPLTCLCCKSDRCGTLHNLNQLRNIQACCKMHPGGSRRWKSDIVAGRICREESHCCVNGGSVGNEKSLLLSYKHHQVSPPLPNSLQTNVRVRGKNNNSIRAIGLDPCGACLLVCQCFHSQQKW